MHVYYIMIKSSQKFWVVYVRYRFIPEQCALYIPSSSRKSGLTPGGCVSAPNDQQLSGTSM